MKAVLLSAGLGERLRPITDNMPKVMVPLAGKPLLQYTVEALKAVGVSEFYLNIFYKGEVIKNHFGNGEKFDVSITYLEEPSLWGTGYALKQMRRWLADGEFLIVYGDKYLEFDFVKFFNWHKQKNGFAGIVVGETKNPLGAGIMMLDDNQRIIKFKEKPKPDEVFSNISNKGICIFKPEIFDHIPDDEQYDIGHHLIPALISSDLPIYGYWSSEKIIDMGTPEKYYQLNKELSIS